MLWCYQYSQAYSSFSENAVVFLQACAFIQVFFFTNSQILLGSINPSFFHSSKKHSLVPQSDLNVCAFSICSLHVMLCLSQHYQPELDSLVYSPGLHNWIYPNRLQTPGVQESRFGWPLGPSTSYMQLLKEGREGGGEKGMKERQTKTKFWLNVTRFINSTNFY